MPRQGLAKRPRTGQQLSHHALVKALLRLHRLDYFSCTACEPTLASIFLLPSIAGFLLGSLEPLERRSILYSCSTTHRQGCIPGTSQKQINILSGVTYIVDFFASHCFLVLMEPPSSASHSSALHWLANGVWRRFVLKFYFEIWYLADAPHYALLQVQDSASLSTVPFKLSPGVFCLGTKAQVQSSEHSMRRACRLAEELSRMRAERIRFLKRHNFC